MLGGGKFYYAEHYDISHVVMTGVMILPRNLTGVYLLSLCVYLSVCLSLGNSNTVSLRIIYLRERYEWDQSLNLKMSDITRCHQGKAVLFEIPLMT